MARKSVDCREHPSEINCSVRIEGSEEEVMKIMTRHVVEDHGEKNSAEVQQMIRDAMKDVPEGRRGQSEQAPAPIH